MNSQEWYGVDLVIDGISFKADHISRNGVYIVYGTEDMKRIEYLSELVHGIPYSVDNKRFYTEKRLVIHTVNMFDNSMTETWFRFKERK